MSEYAVKRQKMVNFLGGSCVDCQSKEDLQFDHIDRTTKEFDISKNWARSWAYLEPELRKCCLRCKPCHNTKSYAAGDLVRARHDVYGQMQRTHKCKCEVCKESTRRSMEEFYKRHGGRSAYRKRKRKEKKLRDQLNGV